MGIGLSTGAGILLGQAIIGQLFSATATILPALQAAALYPADALRYE